MAESNFNSDRVAIEAYFGTNWASATPVKYENRKFIQPGTQNQTRVPWAALYIRPFAGWQASLGVETPLRRHVGQIITQVFTDLDIGTERALTLASNVADIWRDATFTTATNGRIWCNGYLDGGKNTEPELFIVGNDGNGWFQVNVIARYRREDYF